MMKRLFSAVAALLLSTGLASAQTQCDQGKLDARIDLYAAQPFSALNWRVINGLGDPEIEPSAGLDGWESQDEYKKLVQTVLKLQAPPEVAYDCRTGYPVSVLKRHIAQFGINDPYVVQWANVQQQVFSTCGQPNAQPPVMIDPLVGVDQAREIAQRDDRAYQAASMAFYTDKAKAVELFRAIGASGSPHKAAARYNVANLLANGKQLAEARKEAAAILADASLTTVHTITKELQGYIANLEDTASGWTLLIDDSIATLMRPTSDIQSSPDHRKEFARALSDIDYAGIRDKEGDWWLKGELPENPTISKAIVDATRKSPMALWMVGGQSLHRKQQRLGWAMRGEKWQSYASAYAGRVVAVTPAGSTLPQLAREMLETLAAPADAKAAQDLWSRASSAATKAKESCGAAPETAALPVYMEQALRASAVTGDFATAYSALQQSAFRGSDFISVQMPRRIMAYLLASGGIEEGRRFREALLSDPMLASLPESSRVNFVDEAARFKAWVAEDEPAWRNAVLASTVSTSSPLLNLLTGTDLWSLSEDGRFSTAERALFARVAWTRAYARSRSTKPETLKRLLAADARLAQSFDVVAKEFPKLSPERQQLLFVLRNPRLGILANAPDSWQQTGLEAEGDASYEDAGSGDHNDRNWWCPLQIDRHLGAIRQAFDLDADIPQLDGYSRRGLEDVFDLALRDKAVAAREAALKAHPVVKRADWKSLARLAEVPSAPRKLAEAAISWGKASRGQDGAPEALARAVGVTRSGCNWHGGHGTYSKAAQTLLKARFGESPYAAQTPYWFDCMRNEWDEQGNRVASCKPKEWPKQSLPR